MVLDTIRRIGELAERQWGMLTTAQAGDASISRLQLSRLEQAGVLERVTHGVYRSTSTPAHEHEQILAAWMALGGEIPRAGVPPLVVGGAAAARLYGIGDLFLTSIDLIAPTRRQSRRADVRLRQLTLSADEIGRSPQGVPTLTPARTIADLVQQVGDLSLVGDALRDAREAGLVDEATLLRHLEQIAASVGEPDGSTLLGLLGVGEQEAAA